MEMKKYIFRIPFITVAAIGSALFLCAACTPKEPIDPPSKEELESRARAKIAVDEAISRRVPTTTVDMDCYEHDRMATNSIGSYAVEEVWYGQITKKFVGAAGLGCGGVLYLGYQLPTKWQPHMKVLVRWTPGWSDGIYTVERYTTIPYYDQPSTLHVHFFTKDRVRVIVSSVGTDAPGYPIPPNATEPPPEVDGELEQPPNPPNPPPPPKRIE